jgi:hypothetical protein
MTTTSHITAWRMTPSHGCTDEGVKDFREIREDFVSMKWRLTSSRITLSNGLEPEKAKCGVVTTLANDLAQLSQRTLRFDNWFNTNDGSVKTDGSLHTTTQNPFAGIHATL